MTIKAKPHVFEIDYSIWNAISDDEISATVYAMKEFGIYHLPYDDSIIVRIRHTLETSTEASDIHVGRPFYEHIVFRPRGWPNSKNGYARYLKFRKRHPFTIETKEELQQVSCQFDGHQVEERFVSLTPIDQESYCDVLIVLLASKGVEKVSRESKLGKLGIGKQRDEYVTTLRLNPSLERDETAREGHPIRPHLRRGHIRHQHFGPQNSQVKRIWIEPVFVNADADFVSARAGYKVRR